MNFSILRRLDFQDFDFSYFPIAMCGNGGVLLQTNGGTAEVTGLFGLKKILFGGVPRYYIFPFSGQVMALDQPAEAYASLIALSDRNVALSNFPIGIYEPPNGVFQTFPLNPAANPQVTAMNSLGWIVGFDGTAEGTFPWLMIPSLAREESQLFSQFLYYSVPLSQASENAGITKGLGFGVTALAINDVGWVLLAAAGGPCAIVDMSDTANPTVLYHDIPLPSTGKTFMSNTGWIAQQALAATSSTFFVYNPSTSTPYTAELEGFDGSDLSLSIGGINSTGQVVGTGISIYAGDLNAGMGFYWDPANGGQYLGSVSVPGAGQIIGAVGINDAGLIAAAVVGGDGSNYGVLLTVAA